MSEPEGNTEGAGGSTDCLQQEQSESVKNEEHNTKATGDSTDCQQQDMSESDDNKGGNTNATGDSTDCQQEYQSESVENKGGNAKATGDSTDCQQENQSESVENNDYSAQIYFPPPMPQLEGQCMPPQTFFYVVPGQPLPLEMQVMYPPGQAFIHQPCAVPGIPFQNPVPPQLQPYPGPAASPVPIPVGVPFGLECLLEMDEIYIHQKVECIEILTGFETNNKYEIRNSQGHVIYFADENTDCCTRNFCGPARRFEIEIKDQFKREVIHVIRPFRCTSCWYPCCLQELEVQAPPGTPIGYVKQNWHPFLPVYSVQGPNKETVMKIRGPYIPCKRGCCCRVHFKVKDKTGKKSIARISKVRGTCFRRCCTDATDYKIKFPMDMDVKMKAVLLGACFLIDFMYFEKGGRLFFSLL